jgi:NAD(P)-dependent dehydrogenase (short-subunit alcohol dehydrogenase family)
VAIAFAMEGADVAILYNVNDEDAAATRAAVESKGRRCEVIKADVRDRAACFDAVARTVEALGGLDILVNNAAFQKAQPRFEDITEEQFRRTFETNIFGYFHMAQAALPHLQKGDCIINTGSIVGLTGLAILIDYTATKGAIHAFTKSLALSLGERGIRVNCVVPGPVWTPNIPGTMPADEVENFGTRSRSVARPARRTRARLRAAGVQRRQLHDRLARRGDRRPVVGGMSGPDAFPPGGVRALLAPPTSPSHPRALQAKLDPADRAALLRAQPSHLRPLRPADPAVARLVDIAGASTSGWPTQARTAGATTHAADRRRYRRGLRDGRDRASEFGAAFLAFGRAAGRVIAGGPEGASPARRAGCAARWFEEALVEATEIYFAHPLAQERIGYVGMADAAGWSAIGLNEDEPRDAGGTSMPRHSLSDVVDAGGDRHGRRRGADHGASGGARA